MKIYLELLELRYTLSFAASNISYISFVFSVAIVKVFVAHTSYKSSRKRFLVIFECLYVNIVITNI